MIYCKLVFNKKLMIKKFTASLIKYEDISKLFMLVVTSISNLLMSLIIFNK